MPRVGLKDLNVLPARNKLFWIFYRFRNGEWRYFQIMFSNNAFQNCVTCDKIFTKSMQIKILRMFTFHWKIDTRLGWFGSRVSFIAVFACVRQEFSGGTGDDLSLRTLMKIACPCNYFRSALDVANVLWAMSSDTQWSKQRYDDRVVHF